ncbi:snf7 family protein, partial [Cystoisospora suis]
AESHRDGEDALLLQVETSLGRREQENTLKVVADTLVQTAAILQHHRRSSAALPGKGHLSRAVGATRQAKEKMQRISNSFDSFSVSGGRTGLGKGGGLQAELAQLQRQVLDERTAELLATLPPVPSSSVLSSPPRGVMSCLRGRSRQCVRPPRPRILTRPFSLRRAPAVCAAVSPCQSSMASFFHQLSPQLTTVSAPGRAVLWSSPSATRQRASIRRRGHAPQSTSL